MSHEYHAVILAVTLFSYVNLREKMRFPNKYRNMTRLMMPFVPVRVEKSTTAAAIRSQ